MQRTIPQVPIEPDIYPVQQPPEKPGRRPEVESDVQPQRHPGEPPLPDESDNIPGDENDPDLVRR